MNIVKKTILAALIALCFNGAALADLVYNPGSSDMSDWNTYQYYEGHAPNEAGAYEVFIFEGDASGYNALSVSMTGMDPLMVFAYGGNIIPPDTLPLSLPAIQLYTVYLDGQTPPGLYDALWVLEYGNYGVDDIVANIQEKTNLITPDTVSKFEMSWDDNSITFRIYADDVLLFSHTDSEHYAGGAPEFIFYQQGELLKDGDDNITGMGTTSAITEIRFSTVVPEPAHYAAIFGVFTLMLAFRRRK